MPLSDLAAALAAATGPDRALDERLGVSLFGLTPRSDGWWDGPPLRGRLIHLMYPEPPAYTSSLDAITGAIREKWPRAIVRTRETAYESGAELGAVGLGKHNTLVERPASVALALCLAAVRLALAEEGR